jgi:ribosomal protein L32
MPAKKDVKGRGEMRREKRLSLQAPSLQEEQKLL